MSKERDLLVSCLDEFQYHEVPCSDLIRAIRWVLAEPEQEPKFNFDLERMKAAIESPISDVTVDDLAKQVKQDPVAWMWANEELGGFYFSNIENPNWKPLYTAPPKREPLSDKEITKNTPKLIHIGERLAFHAGVRFSERHHIIGGGE